MLSGEDLSALFITLKMAAVSTCILLLFGSPVAWLLARYNFRFKSCLESLIALPLVLPPTVLGFYLLIAMGPSGLIGNITRFLGLKSFAFSFSGLVLGSVIYSLPFVIHPLRNSFAAIDENILAAAATLRTGPISRFFTLVLPLAKPGYLVATVLGFAHTMGEFGVVLMIGGNIPGETRVLSISIYDHVEAVEYSRAHVLSALLLVLSFLVLLLVYRFNKPSLRIAT